jgi:hypothetical protein
MKSKAEQLAEERYPILWDEKKQPFHVMVRNAQRAAFIAGLQVGMEFAEWCNTNDWYYNSSHKVWVNTRTDMEELTEELFEIYLKEKHDTTTH